MSWTTGGGEATRPTSVTPHDRHSSGAVIIFMVIVPVTPKGLDALVPQPPRILRSSSSPTTAPSSSRFCIAPVLPRRTRSTRLTWPRPICCLS